MRPIEAQNQVRLGPRRCLQLALSGMAFRMFRSGITTAILALAVAFLVHMIVYGLISNEVQSRAYAQLQSERNLGQVLTRLTTPDSPRIILESLGTADSDRIEQYRLWANNVEPATFDQAVEAARKAVLFEQYLESLPAASQAALVGGRTIGRYLRDMHVEGGYQATVDKAEAMTLPPPPDGGWAEIETLVNTDWPVAERVALEIYNGHLAAIRKLSKAFSNQAMVDVAVASSPEFVEQVRAMGFEVDFDTLQDFARRQRSLAVFSQALEYKAVRQDLIVELDLELSEFSTERVLREMESASRVQWMMDVLAKRDIAERSMLDAQTLLEVSQRMARERRLEAAVRGYDPGESGMPFGLPTRTMWLIGLSFLVCAVGVANAMLMSVTERFTEIATMKCLGAMDFFVMLMFVFEAMLQGIIGGVLGLVLGVLLAYARGFVDYGGLIGGSSGIVLEMLMASLLSLGAGVMLATFAAIGPSWVAARLAPMEAMRVD